MCRGKDLVQRSNSQGDFPDSLVKILISFTANLFRWWRSGMLATRRLETGCRYAQTLSAGNIPDVVSVQLGW